MRAPVAPSQGSPTSGAQRRFLLLLVGLLFGLAWTMGSRAQGQMRNPHAVPRTVTPREALKPEERNRGALLKLQRLTRGHGAWHCMEIPHLPLGPTPHRPGESEEKAGQQQQETPMRP